MISLDDHRLALENDLKLEAMPEAHGPCHKTGLWRDGPFTQLFIGHVLLGGDVMGGKVEWKS